MDIMEMSIDGKVYHSLHYGDFVVINKHNDMSRIKFLLTGYEYEVKTYIIRKGWVKDPFYPIVYSVGYLGGASSNHPMHKTWEGMLSRCYNSKDKNYHNYGGLGVRVCERWHNFANFIEDVVKLPNYDKKLEDPSYQLDKDELQQDVPKSERVYAPETCCFISPRNNIIRKYTDSKLIGVTKRSRRAHPPVYVSRVVIDNHIRHIGGFTNEIAAANAYRNMCKFYGIPYIDQNIPYMDPIEIAASRTNQCNMVKIVNDGISIDEFIKKIQSK